MGKDVGQPVVDRHWYYTEVDQYFTMFSNQEQHITNRMVEVTHLTDENKAKIHEKVTASQEFFAKVKADKESKQLYQDPAFGIDGIGAHLKSLNAETEAIFNIPPPKPKEEPKKDESKSPEKKEEGEAPKEEGEK